MEDHARHDQDDDADRESQQRQIRDVDGDEEHQDHALPRECQHVGRLRERHGLLGDGSDDFRPPDGVERNELECRTRSIRRTRNLWMMASISTVVAIRM
jgi:hypothetical protein